MTVSVSKARLESPFALFHVNHLNQIPSNYKSPIQNRQSGLKEELYECVFVEREVMERWIKTWAEPCSFQLQYTIVTYECRAGLFWMRTRGFVRVFFVKRFKWFCSGIQFMRVALWRWIHLNKCLTICFVFLSTVFSQLCLFVHFTLLFPPVFILLSHHSRYSFVITSA